MNSDQMGNNFAIVGSVGSGKTTRALQIKSDLYCKGVNPVVIDGYTASMSDTLRNLLKSNDIKSIIITTYDIKAIPEDLRGNFQIIWLDGKYNVL